MYVICYKKYSKAKINFLYKKRLPFYSCKLLPLVEASCEEPQITCVRKSELSRKNVSFRKANSYFVLKNGRRCITIAFRTAKFGRHYLIH